MRDRSHTRSVSQRSRTASPLPARARCTYPEGTPGLLNWAADPEVGIGWTEAAMRSALITFIAYGAAVDSALLGLWLADKWPSPGWKQYTVVGSVFISMNVVMQILIG
ncbi:hypothetical protein SCMU_29650 [Sinomonas cyclohexanicum]|uniref:Uncharacterized protein n=2 Tax=Sinomonas cyclohexanicum TaxID=322009 RepID=A0ABM7PXW6_SINCY|nr:hypothetical protein SCMU_29650 [Corynebacterium cyclohexanicum]